jgi:hypothetical protein
MNILTKLMCALTLISTTCIAAEKTLDDRDWYQVEVLIFSQQDLFNEERHITDIELSYPENIRELIDTSVATTLARAHTLPIGVSDEPLSESSSSADQAFLILPKSSLGMASDHTRLNRAPGYRTLYHKAWRQPGLGSTESPWILIKGGNVFGNHHELEGSFRLVRNRYLHVQANLWKTTFKKPEPNSFSNSLPENTAFPNGARQTQTSSTKSAWPTLPNPPQFQNSAIDQSIESKLENSFKEKIEMRFESEYPIADIVTLEQSTQVFRDKLTYLDHPEMGVIVLISKYELPKNNK